MKPAPNVCEKCGEYAARTMEHTSHDLGVWDYREKYSCHHCGERWINIYKYVERVSVTDIATLNKRGQ